MALCILAAAAIPPRGFPMLPSQSPLCHWSPKVGKAQQRPIEQLPGVHSGYDMLQLGGCRVGAGEEVELGVDELLHNGETFLVVT